jgi:SecD/SecF fusion protein
MINFGLVATVLAQATDAAVKSAEVVGVDPPTPKGEVFGWMALLGLAAIVFVPFLLGQAIERWLRMKDVAFRIGLLLFLLTISIAPFAYQYYRTYQETGHGTIAGAIPLGIDLAGGTNLVYQVDVEKARQLNKTVDSATMDKLRDGVARRVDPAGTEEMTVRVVGDDRIEVIVPGADQEKTQRIKDQIVNLGSLEFSIVVNEKDHPELYEKGAAQRSTPDIKEIRDANGIPRARWVPVAFDKAGKLKIEGLPSEELIRDAIVHGKPGKEVLVVNEPDEGKRITGRYLVNAQEQFEATGSVVGFTFNQEGGYLFQNLTYQYQPQEGDPHRTKLAILLSDEVHSAPTINAVIGTQGQITGNFSSAEIQELIAVLNAGALEVPLVRHPVTEFTVSPLLGADVQRAGFRAMILSAIAVFAVVALYYWKAGLVANVCLIVNIILAAGVLSLIDATFTLPGLAGFVLSIAMAVDSNVLIFERIREEQARGASLRMSINNGFDKALSAIVDSNLTTLITAIVLYVIGTDQVKGFAVTLFIGIVVSMYTALSVAKLIFTILERKRWITSLPMANAIGITNVDFLGKTALAMGLATALLLVGLGSVVSRGSNNFDIDFSGGTMVTFQFEEPRPTLQQARAKLEEKLGANISVEELSLGDDPASPEKLIRLRTTEDDPDKVSEQINAAFAGTEFQLVRQHVELGEIEPIPSAPAGDPAAAKNDFAGGQQVQIQLTEPMLASSVAEVVLLALQKVDATRYGDTEGLVAAAEAKSLSGAKDTAFVVRVKPDVRREDLSTALAAVKVSQEKDPFFTEKNKFSTAVGDEMKVTAVIAVLLSMAAMTAYLWFRFQGVTFGLAAIVALAYDVLITLGCVGLASLASGNAVGDLFGFVDFKINLPMIAAFLTVVGYSINDKIVIFDRIREVRGKNPSLTRDMVNQSVNQTLSRTLLTSMTTLIVILILYFMGGEGIHGFAFCLFIGIVIGTFSSIYIASPVLLWLMNRNSPQAARA